MRWWVTLGDFESDEGIVVELCHTPRGLDATEVTRYRPRADRRVHGKGFTGGTFVGRDFYVTSFNGIHVIDEAGRVHDVALRDDFNDLHSVAVRGDELWVTNTGADRVELLGLDGTLRRTIELRSDGESFGPRAADADPYFDQPSDLPFHRRRVVDSIHPNHVGFADGEPIATRFEDGSLQSLATDRSVVPATPGAPHDGAWIDGLYWITCTNGWVLAYEPTENRWLERVRIDGSSETGVTGWCRGLSVHDNDFLIGFTRVTRAPRARWCDRPFEPTRTGVLRMDRRTGKRMAFLDLAHCGAHPKVFSIVPVPTTGGETA